MRHHLSASRRLVHAHGGKHLHQPVDTRHGVWPFLVAAPAVVIIFALGAIFRDRVEPSTWHPLP
eukprot:1577347-Pyramimonas_sp.AAC.1